MGTAGFTSKATNGWAQGRLGRPGTELATIHRRPNASELRPPRTTATVNAPRCVTNGLRSLAKTRWHPPRQICDRPHGRPCGGRLTTPGSAIRADRQPEGRCVGGVGPIPCALAWLSFGWWLWFALQPNGQARPSACLGPTVESTQRRVSQFGDTAHSTQECQPSVLAPL